MPRAHREVRLRDEPDLARRRDACERPALADAGRLVRGDLVRQDLEASVLRDERPAAPARRPWSAPFVKIQRSAGEPQGAGTHSSPSSAPSNGHSAQACSPSTSSQLLEPGGDCACSSPVRPPPPPSLIVLAVDARRLSRALSRKAVDAWWDESNDPTCDGGRCGWANDRRWRWGGLAGGGGPGRVDSLREGSAGRDDMGWDREGRAAGVDVGTMLPAELGWAGPSCGPPLFGRPSTPLIEEVARASARVASRERRQARGRPARQPRSSSDCQHDTLGDGPASVRRQLSGWSAWKGGARGGEGSLSPSSSSSCRRPARARDKTPRSDRLDELSHPQPSARPFPPSDPPPCPTSSADHGQRRLPRDPEGCVKL